MGSNFFKGGLDYFWNNQDPWNDSGTLTASLVEGSSISSTNLYWDTLADFLTQNTLIGVEAGLPSTPNRGTSWAPGANSLEFWFNDPISFGVVAGGNELAGVVYYNGSAAFPTAATVLFCAENLGGSLTSDGGTISWGTSGQNVAARWQALTVVNRLTFQGTVVMHALGSGLWQDVSWRLGYALISAASTATPSMQWLYMSDLPGTVQYCTGGAPGDASQPETLVADREGPAIALNIEDRVYEFGVRSDSAGRTPITWSSAALSAGETIVAVITFAYDTTYNPASAYIIAWDDVPDHTIQAAQEITYAAPAAFTINQGNV